MRAAVDASALIFLTQLGRLDILRQYSSVLTVPEVMEEIDRGLAAGHPEALHVRALVEDGFLRVRAGGRPRQEWNLDPGEGALLALALREKVDETVTDDRPAIAVAKYHGLRPVSVPYLLLRERLAGRISQGAYEALLRQLLSFGYYLTADLHYRLVEAGRGRR